VDQTLAFLIQHGYLVLFATVVLDQVGVPVPAVPFLMAAGALARDSRLNFVLAIGLAVAASLVGHTAWYEAGRRRGARVLRFLCQISLEPDTCVRKTENLFADRGAKSLVFAHFIPGLDIVAQPLAAISGMPRSKFMSYSALAAALWAGSFISVGFLFGHQLTTAAETAARLGVWLVAGVGGVFLGYLGWKIFQRQYFLHQLRVARISPQELKKKLEAGEALAIVDLRHPIEFESEPQTLPGAIRMAAEELESRSSEIPRDREVILYCS
jgi:membrane protein DedA with SNARE-associated domain